MRCACTHLKVHRSEWVKISYRNIHKAVRACSAVAAGRGGAKGAIHPGRHCAGGGIWIGKNIEFLNFTPQLSILFTVHTNAFVVTIRISIGDLIAGVGAATKTFAPGGKHPRATTDTVYSLYLCRILVFAPVPISTVKVQIDGIYIGEAEQSKGPLYVLQWDPFHYIAGLHTITVQAVVSVGHHLTLTANIDIQNTCLIPYKEPNILILLLLFFRAH